MCFVGISSDDANSSHGDVSGAMTLLDTIVISVLPLASTIVCISVLARLELNQSAEKDLFVCLSFMSVFQLLCYCAGYFSQDLMFVLAHIYLLFGYWLFAALVAYTSSLGKSHDPYRRAIYLMAGLFTILHVGGYSTDGFYLEDGVPMHNDGVLGIIPDLYVLFCLLYSGRNIKINLRTLTAKDDQLRSRNIWMIGALCVLGASFFTIMILSMTNYAISVAFAGPIVMLITALMFSYITRTDIMMVGLGREAFCSRMQLMKDVGTMELKPDTVKALKRRIEHLELVEALKISGNDIYQAASYLGIDHSTLRKKLKSFDIQVVTPQNRVREG